SLNRAKAKADSVYNLIATGKMSFSTAASLYSDDNNTKFNGGMVFDPQSATRNTVLSVDQLERDVFLAIDTLNPGEVSKGYQFTFIDETSREGKPAYKLN